MEYKISNIVIGHGELPVYEYEITDSTNTRARELARTTGGDAAVVARGQTRGRGRLGRSFASDTGRGLYMSLLIHPKSNSDAMKLTALMGVAVCRALESLTGLSPKIKWVNDIQLEEKKLAGILAEGEFDTEGRLKYAIIGVGVNILKRDFGELEKIATSLEEHCTPPDANALLYEITNEFYRIYNKASHEGDLSYYKEHSSVLGREITVIRGDESYTARAVDIDESFSLIIEREGNIMMLSSAEVSVRAIREA